MERLSNQSKDISKENIEKIEKLFPNCVTETMDEKGNIKRAIDFDVLKQDLSDTVVEGKTERYQFTWPEKSRAILSANAPTTNILRPVPEKSVDFDHTKNIYIEGDNLEALKILRETYLGKVKMIYIDPPYNTGNDFVYNDNFKESTEEYLKSSGNIDDEGNRMSVNNDTDGRFHSNWLNMMYPRLVLARDFLTDDGVIFISIDDNEVENLKKVCNEIFGEQNYLVEFPRVTKRSGKSTNLFAKNNDYVLAFAKNINQVKISGVSYIDDTFKYRDSFYEKRGPYKLNQTLDYDTLGYVNSLDFPISIKGKTYYPGSVTEAEFEKRKKENPKDGYRWRWSEKLVKFGIENGWIEISKTGRIYTKTYLNAEISKDSNGEYHIEYKSRTKPITSLDFIDNKFSNDGSRKEITNLLGNSYFEYAKPVSLIKALAESIDFNKNEIVLDFFSGSATTADAVLQLNLKNESKINFILVQMPEFCDSNSSAFKAGFQTICNLGEERIRRAGKKIKDESPLTTQDLDVGFRVFKVDSSNMKNLEATPQETQLSLLENYESTIKEDRTSLDLVIQTMIRLGIPLDAEITRKVAEGGTEYFTVNGNDLVCCFAKAVPEKDIEELARLQPLNVAFRDESFAKDEDSVNCEQIFKTLSPITGKNIYVL